MATINLTEQARSTLVEVFRTSEDMRLRQRCQAVLMASRGRIQGQIAEDIGVDRRTVERWLALYRAGGLKGLEISWAPGREPLIDESQAERIVDWVKRGPIACGVERANWTFEELAAHFRRVTGVRVSESTMREFCHRHGIRPYRPTYRFLKADPKKQIEAHAFLTTQKTL